MFHRATLSAGHQVPGASSSAFASSPRCMAYEIFFLLYFGQLRIAPSTSRLAQEFAAEVRQAFQHVRGWCAYIDTIEVLVSVPSVGLVMRQLRDEGVAFSRWSNPNPYVPISLRIHRPPAMLLSWLDQHLGRYILARVDLAVDFHFARPSTGQDEAEHHAAALQGFLAAHITQRWHRRRQMGFSGAGAYLSGPWQGRNIAIYSDRPSKVTGEPCSHVEMRFFSASQVRKLGAISLSALLQLDPMLLLNYQARLSKLNRRSCVLAVLAVLSLRGVWGDRPSTNFSQR